MATCVLEAPNDDARTPAPGQTRYWQDVSMSDIGSLFIGLGSFVGMLGTAIASIIVAVRMPRRAAARAAQGTVSKVLGEPDDDDDDDDSDAVKEAMEAMLEKLLEKRDGERP